MGRPLGLCTLGDLSALPDPVLRRRARHVITECARVREAERLLARGNLVGLGAVMTEGHRSLAEDYRVSVPAVDQLVEHLLGEPGVLGARMSGGGFGGCVIALCGPDSPCSTRRPTPRTGAGGSARLPAQLFSRRSDQRVKDADGFATVDRLRRQRQPALHVIDPSRRQSAAAALRTPMSRRAPCSPSSTERITAALKAASPPRRSAMVAGARPNSRGPPTTR